MIINEDKGTDHKLSDTLSLIYENEKVMQFFYELL